MLLRVNSPGLTITVFEKFFISTRSSSDRPYNLRTIHYFLHMIHDFLNCISQFFMINFVLHL